MDINQHNTVGAAQQDVLKPEYLRPAAACRVFSLGRSKLYELLAEGKLKSVSMRKRGQRHGTRLISYDSLKNYLESLAEGGES
jgi:excisionase family DNA binding protein